MPRSKFKRIKTKYPGVFYVMGTTCCPCVPEKIYYIRYRKAGKLREEVAGRQYDGVIVAGRQYDGAMTPTKARALRAQCILTGRKPLRPPRRRDKG